MKYIHLVLLAFLSTPFIAHAQGLDDFFKNLIVVIENVFIPFLFGIAFLFFVINVVRFFVVQSNNQEGREKARSLISFSVMGFVFVVIFWGAINLLASSIGLDDTATTGLPCSDYMDMGTNCTNNPFASTGGGTSGTGSFGSGTSGAGSGTGSSGSPGSGSSFTPPVTTGSPIKPTKPVIDTSVYPTKNIDNIAATADAAQTKVAVETTAVDFISKLPDIYDWRTRQVIEEAVAAASDPVASNEERVIAAIRLTNNNQMTASDLTKFVAVLNTEQKIAGEPEIVLANLYSAAAQPPDTLGDQIAFTQQSLLPVVTSAQQSFFEWGAADTATQEAAQNDVNDLYREGLTATQRVAAFDDLVSEGSYPSDDTVPNLRNRFINDINGESFFKGDAPLTVPNEDISTERTTGTGASTGSAGSIQTPALQQP